MKQLLKNKEHQAILDNAVVAFEAGDKMALNELTDWFKALNDNERWACWSYLIQGDHPIDIDKIPKYIFATHQAFVSLLVETLARVYVVEGFDPAAGLFEK